MRKHLFPLIAAAALGLQGTLTAALPQDVERILGKIPAETSEQAEALLAEIEKLGPDAVTLICQQINPAAEGGDTSVRFALNGLAMRLGRPDGNEAKRASIGTAYANALKATTVEDIRIFLILQLEFFAGDEAVPTLADALGNNEVGQAAVRALATIGTRDAALALLNAYPEARGRNRVSIIGALGALGVKAAQNMLLADAVGNDSEIRIAAWQALAQFGAPEAARSIRAGMFSDSRYESGQAAGSYLDLAESLAANGDVEKAVMVCQDILRNRKEAYFQSSALAVLAGLPGVDASREMQAAANSDNRELREAAMKLMLADPAASASVLKGQLAAATTPERKAEVLRLLGGTGSEEAEASITKALKDGDETVRIAAFQALRELSGEKALPTLFSFIENGSRTEARAAQAEILRLPDPMPKVIANVYPKATAKQQTAIVEILGERQAKAQKAVVFGALDAKDRGVQRSAFRALGGVSEPTDLPRLVDLLVTLDNAGMRSAVQRVVVSLCRENPVAANRAQPVLSKLNATTGESRTALLETLAGIGGEAALARVVADARSNDAATQDAATRVLTKWQGPEALPALTKIALASKDETHRILALRAALRLNGASTESGSEKAERLAAFLAADVPDGEKQAIIAGFANAPTPETVETLLTLLDHPTYGDEADAILQRLVLPTGGKDALVTGPAAVQAAKKVARRTMSADVQRAALQVIKGPPPGNTGNVAVGKPTKTSIPHEASNSPDKAVDGRTDSDTGWWGVGHNGPRWWQVDLQQIHKLDRARVFFYADGRHYQYTLSVSTDGENWKEVVNARDNTSPSKAKGELYSFAPVDTRYFRVTVFKNSANPSTHLREVQLYPVGVGPDGEKPAETASGSWPEADAEGFVPLFNGKDFTGWTGDSSGHFFDGDVLVVTRPGHAIKTQRSYADFHLKFDFRLTPGANNGIWLRGGFESQVLDNTSDRYKNLKAWQYHGSIYGAMPAKRGVLKPLGEWNSEEIILKRRNIQVKLNGQVIVEGNLDKAIANAEAGGDQYGAGFLPGMKSPSGPLGLMGHNEHVEFRNMRIKDMTEREWVSIFNGRNLDGWTGLVGNPETRPGMSAADREKGEAKAAENVRKHWKVEDGVIVTTGHGANLCTTKTYGDFEMKVDWMIQPNGDSGIYLRGSPQVQIWDPENKSAWQHGADKGSGGLWNNRGEGRFPIVKADNPAGQWNSFHIRMTGDRVSIILNGKLVVDNAVMENYWNRSKPIYPREQIELQAHGNTVKFRNIFIREL